MAEGLNAAGAFPVYDTSGNINLYARTLAKQQAERASEQKALQDQLGKLKIDAVRDPDKPILYEGYSKLKSDYSKILSEKDPLKKMQAQSEFDKQFLWLNDFASKSRSAEKDDDDFSSKLLDDRIRNQFTDDAVARAQRNRTLPITHPDYIRDKSTLQRQIDTSKILDDISKIDDQLLQSAKYDNPVTRRVTSGNKTGTESIYTKRVDPKVQALNYAMKYDTDRTFKAFVQKEYGQLFDQMGEDAAKAAAIQDLVGKRPLLRQDSPKMEWDRPPDNFYAHYDYRMNNPLDGGANSDIALTQRQQWIQDMKNRVPDSGERLKAFINGNPEFDPNGKLAIGYDPKNRNILQFDVPAKVTYTTDDDGKTVVDEIKIPRKKYRIDVTDKNFETQVNEVLNNVTGQRVDIGSLLGIKGNKNKPTVPQLKSNKSSGTIRMEVNGRVGEIPADKVADFMKKYPKAKRLK